MHVCVQYKILFFLFFRELRLQHVRMTRDRKSHEKKVCTCTLYTHTLHKNIMYMYYTVYLQTCMHIYFISQVAELNEKANEMMMMLKFGRIVNLDALEGLTTNKLN